MLLTLNTVYKFNFSTGYPSTATTPTNYSALDGSYKVMEKLSYTEIVNQEIDMAAGLFTLIGKTIDDYEAVRLLWINSEFYKLLNAVDGTTTIYVPTELFAKFPMFNVNPYQQVMLMINLGVFDDPTKFETVTQSIANILAAEVGVVANAETGIGEPVLATFGEISFLTDAEYHALEEARAVNKSTVVNHLVLSRRLQTALTEANARIEALTEIIVNQQNPIP